MNYKIAFIIAIIIGAIVIGAAVYMKITQSSESQKAKQIVNYTFEPHWTFGCATYRPPVEKK